MRFSVVSLVLAVMVSGGARACVGARPLAMGGAFVAVADDVNATYWNPAGLSQIPAGKIEITGMHTTTNRDQINYQDYAAAATTLAVPKLGESGTVSIGASYVMSRQLAEDRNTKEVFDFNDHWIWVSGAAKIKMYIAQDDLFLRRSVAYNDQGQEASQTDFSNIKVNGEVDPKTFVYTPPAGVNVMDLTAMPPPGPAPEKK